jgi:hypothetical protein
MIEIRGAPVKMYEVVIDEEDKVFQRGNFQIQGVAGWKK